MKILRLLLIAMFSIVSGVVMAQNATVKGTVTDDLNNFVEGAKIVLKGTSMSAVSDANGVFELKEVPFGDYSIEIAADNHLPYSKSIKVNSVTTDLGFFGTTVTGSLAENSQDDIPEVSLSDSEIKESSSQTVSGVLNASRDAFNAAASYTFSGARFKVRGYDNENTVTYMNGVPMTDLTTGNSMFFLWSGLNDVVRNRDNVTGLAASGFAFGGIGGSSYIDSRASKQRKQLSVSVAASNRVYENRVMATFGSGLLKGGWAISGSVTRRWSDEGYVPGTYYDGWSYYLAAEKIINSEHSISLTTFGAPTERGKSSPAMQELYDIAGTNYYNPVWGYQDGKKRNANLNISHQPVAILSHDWKMNNQSLLRTSIGASMGENINTGLDWYNAPDPRPDYYRRLPSFYDNPEMATMIDYLMRTYEDQRQLNWEKMYEANENSYETITDANGIKGSSISGKRSAYIQEERVADSKKFHFNSTYSTSITDNIQFNGGIFYMKQKTDNFKRVRDLLGGEFYVDVNQYAEQDFGGNEEALQNDLNNPNRILHEGDKFGYNYTSEINRGGGWAQAQYKLDNFDFFGAVELSQTSFKRIGNVRNGLFKFNSFGESETQSFFNYALKGGATYKINGRNYVFANISSSTRAPFFENAYVSVRTRDQLAPNLQNEKIFSAEGGYLLRAPKMKARAVFYFTQFKDQVNTVSFYHADYRDFVNYTISNIDKRHVGAELAFDYNIGKGFSANIVAAIGEYFYTDRPNATITVDNTSEILAESETVYAKNFFVSGTPQNAYTLGLSYRAKKFWFVNLNFNYYDKTYIDFNPARRTTAAVDLVPENSAEYNAIVDQEKADSQFTMDLFGGKSWKLNNFFPSIKRNTFLVFNVGVSNLLDNKDQVTGGYEQLRYDFEDKDPNAFAPKYFYSFGRTYFVNLILRMN
ncbi:MAG: carboxypeptidase-like regulatory domain-containing protein [Bacteroidetes bacterium]|nr:carboxypeptidase-like regulatory domain-containing protein [Bacteroidota bacterium]